MSTLHKHQKLAECEALAENYLSAKKRRIISFMCFSFCIFVSNERKQFSPFTRDGTHPAELYFCLNNINGFHLIKETVQICHCICPTLIGHSSEINLQPGCVWTWTSLKQINKTSCYKSDLKPSANHSTCFSQPPDKSGQVQSCRVTSGDVGGHGVILPRFTEATSCTVSHSVKLH